ncbi:MAG: tryptophan hydroxylase [Paludibacterium sp.]|uniref:tryptophan hydroxylase n=1 Tax=Paludibacterium sp. TaxID=1917523 RepID=UPI0025D9B106|nr:tryptophan hydroxylase [Paludibacterium sp.]MBV8047729.1 tryptophan hydroxylase [Paludibacterium sp.]MBV8648310.1 tryptophan hydroxylase [Paludibacterium sp.]
MHILVIGAGPAGLIFASQMKRARPGWRIRILEKLDQQAETGWGVVLPGRAGQHPANVLSYLDAPDGLQPQYLSEFLLARRGVSCRMPIGVPMCGVGRQGVVQALRAQCQALGVELRYRQAPEMPAVIDSGEFDLVVLANGVGHQADPCAGRLRPRAEFGRNHYLWCGTTRLFDQMSLMFQPHAAGGFVAHAYRYSAGMSTFIVECGEDTYVRAGLDHMSAREAAAFLSGVFQGVLHGQPLLMQAEQGWRRFLTLSRDAACDGGVVLLGDALQSGHFSIGHGTTMAVATAQGLVKALCADADVDAALAVYGEQVLPLAALFKAHADCSRQWFETVDERMHWDLLALARHFEARRQALPSLAEAVARTLADALDR